MGLCLIFYAAAANGKTAKILDRIEAVLPAAVIVVCRTPQELSRGLMRPLSEVIAVVLNVGARDDLMDILSLRDVLHETRVILILPEPEREILVMGHSLRPRYLTYLDEEPEALASVLGKILETRIGSAMLTEVKEGI
jgi:hypothetical protein